jgi:hypothetical protein
VDGSERLECEVKKRIGEVEMKWVLLLVSIHAFDKPLRTWFPYETEKACRAAVPQYLAYTDEKDGAKYVLVECHKVKFDPEKP